jgi:hypothetical protein
MNKRGHSKTLVASQPGNTNAAKAGVYSARLRAPRVAEIEAAVEGRPAKDVRLEIIRHDMAGLWALLEAIDAAFEGRALNSRSQLKELVAARLRLSKTIRAAALEYEQTTTQAAGGVVNLVLPDSWLGLKRNREDFASPEDYIAALKADESKFETALQATKEKIQAADPGEDPSGAS